MLAQNALCTDRSNCKPDTSSVCKCMVLGGIFRFSLAYSTGLLASTTFKFRTVVRIQVDLGYASLLQDAHFVMRHWSSTAASSMSAIRLAAVVA